MLVVTTEGIAGYVVQRVIGEVVGVTVRTRNVYIEGVKQLTGERNPHLPLLLTRWRQEAVARMSEEAARRGANAVVGMRFDHRDISDMWVELCAYGTAVFVVSAGIPAGVDTRPQPRRRV
jgi:uncharacterized protein YbjQ (UPF0145 family)